MKANWVVIGLMSAAMLVGCKQNKNGGGESAEEDEVKMTLDQVPAAAREGLQREAGGATITKVDNEKHNGQTVYETDVKSGGKTWEIMVDENGNLVSKKAEDESGEKGGKKDED
jgi:uncharacterized membrane protein YkoI